MFEKIDSPEPWPPGDKDSTSAVKWACAFANANPEIGDLKYPLATWFLYALRAGYRAGMAHAEFPDA